jgi:hypothetical protein
MNYPTYSKLNDLFLLLTNKMSLTQEEIKTAADFVSEKLK